MSNFSERHYPKLPWYQDNNDDQDEGAGENQHMFDKFDEDDNGEINWEELKNYLSSVDEYASLEDIKVWFPQ